MELYIKDPATNKPRVTDDVDIVVEIATRSAYDQFENELRGLGFINDISGPSCRFIFNEVKVDVISTSIDTSGFTNIWYEKGFEKNFIVKVKEYQSNTTHYPICWCCRRTLRSPTNKRVVGHKTNNGGILFATFFI